MENSEDIDSKSENIKDLQIKLSKELSLLKDKPLNTISRRLKVDRLRRITMMCYLPVILEEFRLLKSMKISLRMSQILVVL